MKTTFLIITTIGCFALGILDVIQSAKLKDEKHQLEVIKQEYQNLSERLEKQTEAIENVKSVEAKAQILQKTLHESATATIAESKKVEKLQASLDQAKTNNPFHAVTDMLKDPDMRKMVIDQQKIAMGPILEKQYGDFLKQMNLSPEQSAAFKDLIVKRTLAGTDVGLAMMDDSLDASQRADLAKKARDQTAAVETEIKQLLGDNNYQSFQNYEKTVADRTTLSQFSDQLAGSPTALTPEQQSQMIQTLGDARSNFKWTSGLNDGNAGADGNIAGILTEDRMAKFIADSEQFDQQVLVKVQPILTAEQYAAYQKFQKQQRDLQLVGLKMARQMFNSGAK